MKLGLVTYNIARDWDLPTLIENCVAAQIDGVEPRTTHAHGIEPDLGPAARREVKRRFADAGLTLWGIGTACDFHYPDPDEHRQQVERAKRFCDLARDLGAVGVKVRPNGLPPDVPRERTLAQIAQALRQCGQIAQDNGVELWLEVHGRESQHPPVIREIIERCGHPNVGVCWNSNPTDLLDGSVRTYFELLRPFLRSVHIHDLWSEEYPYRELFTLLRGSGYDRYTLCEVGDPLAPDAGKLFLQCYRGLHRELTRN
jgi:sugar phosphate isomerase/epimerase